MHGTGDLTGLALVMGAALLCGLGMRRLGQPPIVGYILAGVILGPSALGLVGNREAVTFLAELGVLLLLFLVAMEMSLYAFREVWKVSAAATVLQIASGFVLMVPVVLLGGLSWKEAAVLGFVVALSSTAVVIKLLEQTNILRQPVGQLVIGILIAQDLAVVPLLIGVSLLGPGTFSPWIALKFVAALAAVAALIWFLARRKRLVVPLVHQETPGELVALSGLAVCFGGAAITGLAGLTPALGAFLAGLVIGNSTARHPMIVSTRPIQGVLLMVFFLSVGLLIDFKFLAAHWGAIVLLLLAVIVAKTALNIGILALLREPWPHAFIAGVLLAQIGEFSLVIAGAAERGNLVSSALGQMIVAVIAFSLLLSPLWLFTTRRLLRVVILGMTSLHDTLDAIRSRRLTAAGRGVVRALRWGRERLSRLRRAMPRAGGSAAAALDQQGEPRRRRRKGDTLTPDRGRGVVEPPEAPETPRFPPPDGRSTDGTLSAGPPPETRPPGAHPRDAPSPGTPSPDSTPAAAPAEHREREEQTQRRTGPPPEFPPDAPGDGPRYPPPDGAPSAPPAEIEDEPEPPPRPKSSLRRPITDSPTETPRYPPPSGPPPIAPPQKPKPE
jgi:CPA2 family monovalent cation:H+ antiporter-2